LHLGGATFTGGGVLAFTSGTFQVTLNGVATVPGLFPERIGTSSPIPALPATATLDQDGLKEMQVGVRDQSGTNANAPGDTTQDRPGPIPVATFTGNTTRDDVDANLGDSQAKTAGGDTTLRAAVQQANFSGYATRIVLPAGHFTLTLPGRSDF